MGRVSNILLRVRDTLGDHKKERWSDERLIRLLDEAQKDICRRAKLLRSQASFVITDGVAEYQMPEDFLLLDKVDINAKRVPLIGHTDLDNRVSEWTKHKGKTTYIVYDKQVRGKLRLYPIPDFDNASRFIPVSAYQSYRYGKVHDRYGCIANAPKTCEFPTGIYGFTHEIEGVFQYMDGDIPKVFTKIYQVQSYFGVVTDVSFAITPDVPKPIEGGEVSEVEGMVNEGDFGVVAGFEVGKEVEFRAGDDKGVYFTNGGGFYPSFAKNGEISNIEGAKGDDFGFISGFDSELLNNIDFDGVFGITTSLESKDNIMEVYYLRKPNPITNLDSEIEIDDNLDKALKYYVTGMAFRDDLDTQNRSMGDSELKLYERELEQAYLDDSSDFTRNDASQYETRYNGWGF